MATAAAGINVFPTERFSTKYRIQFAVVSHAMGKIRLVFTLFLPYLRIIEYSRFSKFSRVLINDEWAERARRIKYEQATGKGSCLFTFL